MKTKGESGQQPIKGFFTVEKIQGLRVYDAIEQEVYETLSVYMDKKRMSEEKRHRVQNYIRDGLSSGNRATDRRNWREQPPSILILPTDQKKDGVWYHIQSSAEAKNAFETYTDLSNLPEKARITHPKDYRLMMCLLERNRIMQMPVYEVTGYKKYERLTAFVNDKKMTKPEKRNIVDEIQETLLDIIRYDEFSREELKQDQPALIAEFTGKSGSTPVFDYTVMPKARAQEVYELRLTGS